MSSKAEARALLKRGGMSDTEIDAVLGQPVIADTQVRLNEGDELKYGLASIYKVQPNGSARSKMGLRTLESFPTLIAQLQEAYASLEGSEEFTPFALAEEDSDE